MKTKLETLSDSLYRQLYILAAVAALIVMFTGFARSYFLSWNYEGAQLTPLFHFHGFIMTLWFLIFLLQSFLIKHRNVTLHRRLGVLGAIIAIMVVIVGPMIAIASARRHPEDAPFIIVPFFEIMAFAILVSIGLLMRKRKDFHKRLMVLASLGILTAAIVRIPLEFIQKASVPFAFALDDLLILSVVAFDTIKNRRLHPAYGWGFVLLVTLQVARFVIMGTAQWSGIANWLVR